MEISKTINEILLLQPKTLHNIYSYDDLVQMIINFKKLSFEHKKNVFYVGYHDKKPTIYTLVFHRACYDGNIDTIKQFYEYCLHHDKTFLLSDYVIESNKFQFYQI